MYKGVSHANMEKYHFVSQERLAELRKLMYDTPTDLERVGDYFHALEDTYAHSTGVGDRNWKYYHDGGAANIGHGLHGHDPDFTWNDYEKADTMAKTVFDEFVAFAKHQGVAGAAAWSSVQGKVHDFNFYFPGTYMDLKFRRLTETATFEGYTKKIQILDPAFTIGDEYRDAYKDAAHRGVLGKRLGTTTITLDLPVAGQFLIFGF
jgi:hypothetical protein